MAESTCPVHRVTTVARRLLHGDEAASLTGKTLSGRYRVEKALSAGGMGTVFLAMQLAMERTVVVKVLKRELMSDEVAIKRFYREAQTVSRLKHPNIVSVFDFGVDAEVGLPYLVMDFIPGLTLGQIIKAGPLTEQRAAGLLHQVTKALIAAHDAGIVHRDLKPQNIMISKMSDGEEHVSVLDFGIAKILGVETTDPTLTGVGVSLGTPRYMSPEQCRSGSNVTPKSDVYSLGCILYECVAGKPVFQTKEVARLLMMQLSEEPPRLSVPLPTGDPPTAALAHLLDQMLAKNPDARPSTPDVSKRLRELSLGSAPTARLLQPPSEARRSPRWLLLLAPIAGLIFASLAIWLDERPAPVAAAPPIEPPVAPIQPPVAAIEAPPPLAPPPPPEKKEAAKLVESTPAGASILIDGREIGRTPKLVVIPDDRSMLWIELRKAGYRAERVKVARSGGPVSVELSKKTPSKNVPKREEDQLPDLAPR